MPVSQLTGYEVVFAYGDLHIPDEDCSKKKVLIDMIGDLKPNGIIDGGDIINGDSISEYPKFVHQVDRLQDDLDRSYRWMQDINAAAPKAWKVLLEDNHFIRRLEDRKKGQLWLNSLNALNPAELLRLSQTGWKLMSHWLWRDCLLFVHGDATGNGSGRCPSNKVRTIVKDSAISIVRFHTHVTGMEILRQHGDDRLALQLGCFQDLDKADYIKHGNLGSWTTSAGVFYLPKDRNDRTFLFVPVLFMNGKAFLNGKVYTYK